VPVKPMTFKESLIAWRTMADIVEAHLEEMPHLKDLHAELSALVARGIALEEEGDACEARLREVSHLKTVAFAEGRGLRNRMAALLRGSLGLESERLIAFGVPPRKRNPRRRRAAGDAAPVN